MIVGEEENAFLFEFGLIVPAVIKCLFCIICADVVYPHMEKLSVITHFAAVKIFLMYIMLNILAIHRTLKNFRNPESFLLF